MTKKELIKALEELGVEFDPKAKKAELQALLDSATEEASDEELEEVQEALEEFVAPALPTFDGKKVLEILDSGHTPTHFHCKVEGGLTMHVPKELF